MKMKLRIINREGDSTYSLSLEEARQEIQNAIDNGYIPTSNGKSVSIEELRQDDEVTLFPMGIGG